MTAEDVFRFLQMVIMQGNKKEDVLKIMERWVGPYHGKVLQIETDGKFYHVIIMKKGAKVVEGEYPSPDIIFKAPSDVLMQIFRGTPAEDFLRKWEMVIVGNFHETVPMNELITAVVMGGL